MKKHISTTLLGALMICGSFSALAEPEPNETEPNRTKSAQSPHIPKEHMGHERILEKMKEARGKLIREQVGLDEKRAQEVEDLLEPFDTQKRELKKQMHQSKRALKQLLREDSNDQKAYKVALANLRKTHQQMHTLQEQQIDTFAKKLTPKEQAKMLTSLHMMKRKMRKQMMKMRGKHHGKRFGSDDEPPLDE